MAKTIRPLHHLVLCQALEHRGKTKAGILLPWSHRINKATVSALGRGHLDELGKLHESQLKVGDIVVFRASRIETVLEDNGWSTENSPTPKPGAFFLIGEDNILAVVPA